MALLAELINNIPQGLAYKNKTSKGFLPDHLGERKPMAEKSLEQQRLEFVMFKAQLQAAHGKVQ